MKKLIVKYLYLNYPVKVFGIDTNITRAASVIIPVMVIAILSILFFTPGILFWIIFAALIVLTFPIVKSTSLNSFALITAVFLMVTSIWYPHNWWEGALFLYFAAGFLVDRTRFLFPVKYEDLQDDDQRLQYLMRPIQFKTGNTDPTEPTGFHREKLVNALMSEQDVRMTARNYNAAAVIVPIAFFILLIVLYAVLGESDPAYYERRGF